MSALPKREQTRQTVQDEMHTQVTAGQTAAADIRPAGDETGRAAASPARALQEELQRRVMRDGLIDVSPRQVLATIIVTCLAFWVALYQLAVAIF